MAKILVGSEVSKKIVENLKAEAEALKAEGIIPKLAIVRVGEREDDISYERGATKRCSGIGIEVVNFILPQNAEQKELISVIEKINQDDSIHGMLLFRPLPKQMNDEEVRASILPKKDMDGVTEGSLAGVFTGSKKGYPPCTAAACIEILEYYDISITGKKAVVLGRSLVIGKPVAMMLLEKNATVTLCHRETPDIPYHCREADIVIVAVGRGGMLDKDYVRKHQVIIDVGINVNEEGKLCGDVAFDEVESIVDAITPVPGGVGAVTTSVLAKHVIEAAKKTKKI